MSNIIIAGNPVDGFTYSGPYEDHEQATEIAPRLTDGDWWITQLDMENGDYVSRSSIIEALRDAERNDSAADAVEYVSQIVGWSAEDDEVLYPPCPVCGAQGPDTSCIEGDRLIDDHAERGAPVE